MNQEALKQAVEKALVLLRSGEQYVTISTPELMEFIDSYEMGFYLENTSKQQGEKTTNPLFTVNSDYDRVAESEYADRSTEFSVLMAMEAILKAMKEHAGDFDTRHKE